MPKSALVIVESPTKAKTIRKFLPKTFMVEASMGHVRDLPQSAADIPASMKKEEWTRLGVNVENDFEPLYVVPKGKFKIIQELKKKLKDASELYLATDEDREGESISWHLVSVLKPKIPVKRMVFHEITKSAIERSLKEVREVDMQLVRAQETRRILDRLVGYTLSPLIWKKIAFGLSAGRVQSAGLRVIVDRERERMRFKTAQYWDLEADLAKAADRLEARLTSIGGRRVATGKDFEETTGKLKDPKEIVLLDAAGAEALQQRLLKATWKVLSVEEKSFQTKPAPPFITSTLQQEANRKLGMSAKEAMRTAQKLYEEGLITYMRTDSPNLSQEAIQGARSSVLDLFGKDYLSPEPRQYSSKAKGAQEAHEAIRPAGAQFVHPRDAGLSGREQSLYELIWMRTVATQMAEAKKLSVSSKIGAEDTVFTTSGTRILFPGFIKAYQEGHDDRDSAADREVVIPPLKEGDILKLHELKSLSHETKPPARFTEASLVQTLEKEGIGRPSTYASIIDTIVDRGYVRKVANALVPTFTGIAVIQLLETNFSELVDLGFTSAMEHSLDEIAEGKKEWLPYLKAFYLGKNGLAEQVKTQDKKISPEVSRRIVLEALKEIELRVGRFGPYLVAGETYASIPDDLNPSDLNFEKAEEIIRTQAQGPHIVGVDPATGKNIYVLNGRFGPYLQLGELELPKDEPEEEVVEAAPAVAIEEPAVDAKGKKGKAKKTKEPKAPKKPKKAKKKKFDGPKPRRASFPKGMDPKSVTLEQALRLLSLPRELGLHAETGKAILANQGRFGPYVQHGSEFRSLKKEDDVYTVPLARALELLAEPKRARRGAQVIRDVGKHPSGEGSVQLMEGKYGFYVSYGKINASLPKEIAPEKLTLEQAIQLIGDRKPPAKKGRGGGSRSKK